MRTRSNWFRIMALSLLAALPAALPNIGCHRRNSLPDPGIPYDSSSTSEKLATFVYKEEGKLYLLTVGVNATRFHDKDDFIPLSVVLANKTTTPLELHRESFTLVDPANGSRYGLASVAEVRRQGKQVYDRRLMDADHLLTKLSAFRRAESNFFPYEGLLVDKVELHQFQYIFENLYFPRPEGNLLGKRFELHISARGLSQPLFIVFDVPER